MPGRTSGSTRISRRLRSAGFFVAALVTMLAAAPHGHAQILPAEGPVPQAHLSFCLRCHGAQGLAGNPAIPDLANQRRAYLEKQIIDFRQSERRDLLEHRDGANFTGYRDHPDMGAFADIVPADETPALIQALAAGRACRQPPPPPGFSANRPPPKPPLVERCIACHGAKGTQTVNALVPRLAGQSRTYIANQLFAMRRAEYKQDSSAALTLRSHPIMNAIAVGLTTDEIRAIADYLSTLPCQ